MLDGRHVDVHPSPGAMPSPRPAAFAVAALAYRLRVAGNLLRQWWEETSTAVNR